MWLKHPDGNVTSNSYSYSWHPTPHQSTSLQHQPPATTTPSPSAESTHSLCLLVPCSSLEASTPAHGFLVLFPSPHVISLHCWTVCSPHRFDGQESRTRSVFSQTFFFFLISFESASNLTLLSNQITSNFLLSCERFINPINNTATMMIVSRLKLAGNERAEVVLVCFNPVCVFSGPTVHKIPLWSFFSPVIFLHIWLFC